MVVQSTIRTSPAQSLSSGATLGARQQPSSHLSLHEGCRSEVSTVLLCHESQIEQRGAPPPGWLVDRHVQHTHLPQPCPQFSVVT